MPIYEYQCGSCDERLEKLQRISDDKLVDCPVCEKPALKRLVSAAAFRLKGSGWYETDFKKDNKRNLADTGAGAPGKSKEESKSSDSGAEKTAKPTTTSTDKKPATKEQKHA